MQMTRKIIQIAVGGIPFHPLWAVCDDGTLWFLSTHTGSKWDQIKNVPQPDDLPSTRTPQEILASSGVTKEVINFASQGIESITRGDISKKDSCF